MDVPSRRDMATDGPLRCVLALSCAHVAVDLQEGLRAAGFLVEAAEDPPRLLRSIEPDEQAVVLLDDGVCDWLRFVADLVANRPMTQPVLLTDVDAPDEFLAALSAGVAGFAPRDAGVETIVRTIEFVVSSGIAIPRRFVPSLVEHLRHGHGYQVHTDEGPIDVTDREWEILQLLLQRRTTSEMAATMYVSKGTVRSHVSALLHKLGAVDRDDAIAMIEHDAHS